jgi:hypothetical protein
MPTAASAIEVSTQQVLTNTLFIEAKQSFANDVGVTWVTSPSGALDLVIGDVTAGIPDPIPSNCQRVDAIAIRCPSDVYTGFNADLGPGQDSLSVVPVPGADGFLRLKLVLGPGRDRASDQGQTRDIMNGGPGKDQLSSGPGNDRVKGGAQNDLIDCGPGSHDIGIGGPGPFDLGRNCEVVKH